MFSQLLTTTLSTTLIAQNSSDGGIIVGSLCAIVTVLFVLLFVGAVAGFQIWMLIDCIQYESKMPDHDNQFVVWILVLVFTGWIGALVYYFARRPKNRYGRQKG